MSMIGQEHLYLMKQFIKRAGTCLYWNV